MQNKINVGILGYGNLGRGVEIACFKNSDINLVGIFTRRKPEDITCVYEDTKAFHIDDLENKKDEIDVLIICGGSATDLPKQTPYYSKFFNTVDSYDVHAKVNEHFSAVDPVAKEAGTVSVISTGWDPGLFSLQRAYMDAVLPNGKTYTFWGKGLSQGHSQAVRSIEGVKYAAQYTIPLDESLEAVLNGETPELNAYTQHKREVYVVIEEGYDKEAIRKEIVEMPAYFEGYQTEVNFIDEEEFKKDHTSMPHGGYIVRNGQTSDDTNQQIQFQLKLEANPEFTASVLVAYARASYKLQKEGQAGCYTPLDIAPSYLLNYEDEILRSKYL